MSLQAPPPPLIFSLMMTPCLARIPSKAAFSTCVLHQSPLHWLQLLQLMHSQPAMQVHAPMRAHHRRQSYVLLTCCWALGEA